MGHKTDRPSLSGMPQAMLQACHKQCSKHAPLLRRTKERTVVDLAAGVAAMTFLSGCIGSPEEREAVTRGITKGLIEAGGAAADGWSALQSGGWAAGGIVTVIGLIKAVALGWKKAGDMTEEKIVAGVKKHAENGGAPSAVPPAA